MSNQKKKKHNTPAKRQQSNQAAALTQVTQQFSGPIPHPDILNQYNQIIPGAAERILKMAEQDALHVHEMEISAITYAAADQRRGQWCGLAIGIFTMIAAIVALFHGYPIAAATIGGTTVVGLVTVFVTGRIFQAKHQESPSSD